MRLLSRSAQDQRSRCVCELERDGLSSADAVGPRLLADRGKYAAQNNTVVREQAAYGPGCGIESYELYRTVLWLKPRHDTAAKTHGFEPSAVADRPTALDLVPGFHARYELGARFARLKTVAAVLAGNGRLVCPECHIYRYFVHTRMDCDGRPQALAGQTL
jgi:hypothetical protein